MNPVDSFDPVVYSVEENKFLKEHLGEPPVKALKAVTPGVNPKAIQPLLQKVFDLQQLKDIEGLEWCGVEAMKDAIDVWLEQSSKWAADKRRGRLRFPSMHTFDSRNKPQWQGPGSDVQKVKTFFRPDGSRQEFAIPLTSDGQVDWTPDFLEAAPPISTQPGVSLNKEIPRLECFCGHVEKFVADSRSSFNAAKGRIKKHLIQAQTEVERHRSIMPEVDFLET